MAFRYVPQTQTPPSSMAGLGEDGRSALTEGDPLSVLRFMKRLSVSPAPGLNTGNIWKKSVFTVMNLRFKVRSLLPNKVIICRLNLDRVPPQLTIPSPIEYARGTMIPFFISSREQPSSALAAALADPASWSIELIRCTLLGGTAARGSFDYFEANGSTVFVTVVSIGRMEVVEDERANEAGEWTMRGQLRVPRDVLLPFRFSMVAVYVSQAFHDCQAHNALPTLPYASSNWRCSSSQYAIRIAPATSSFRQRVLQPHHIGVSIVEDIRVEGSGALVFDEPAPVYQA